MSKINEDTSTTDIPDVPAGPTGKMPCGRDFFDCSDKTFWGLHTRVRKERGWYKKHYDGEENITNWARQQKNKGRSFYLRHNDMFRKIKNT